MGYQIMYELKMHIGNPDAICRFVNEVEDRGLALEKNGDPKDQTEWGDCEDELKEFSLLYPDYVFRLRGWGQDEDDIWQVFIKNGKAQECESELVFEGFDESKLK